MIVYMTTNLVNGKKYIGKDVANKPSYIGSGKALKAAIKKYGKKNFKKEILAYASSKEELSKLEIYYIKLYGAKESPMFYNITAGGDGGHTADQTYRMKTVYQYGMDGTFIREWKSATEASKCLGIERSKIVTACTRFTQASGFLWRRFKAEDVKYRGSNFNNKSVILYNLDGSVQKVYNSVNEACEALAMNKSKLYRIVDHPRPSLGFTVNIVGCKHKYVPKKVRVKVKKESKIILPIYQYNLEGSFIKEYKNYSDVKNSGFSPQNVRACIQGKRKSAYNFLWSLEYRTDLKITKHEYFTNRGYRENVLRQKPVLQVLNNTVIKEYKSITEASLQTGINNISRCIYGKCKKAGGYQWVFKS